MHIPVEVLLPWLMKLSRNRTYLYVGRILILTLVTLSAIGCAGDWVLPVERDSLACRLGKYECYYGEPLGLLDLIYKFGVPQAMLLIPLVALFSSLLLLFMPPRTYLILEIVNFGAVLVLLFFSAPAMTINYYFGMGEELTNITVVLIVIFCLPLAVAEHAEIIQRRDSFVGYLGE